MKIFYKIHGMDALNQLWFLFILVVLIIISSCFGSEVFYITPSTSVPCHAEPCLTIPHLTASTNTSWLKSNSLNLVFLPGNYTLTSDVSISNISSFSMTPNSTTNGSWTITCHQNASFKFDNINHLWIRGLKFVGCGNNKVLSVNNFTVENSTFLGHWESGTALDIFKNNITNIVNSYFTNNTVGSCQSDPTSYLSSTYALVGGAVIVTKSNITMIINSTFEGNTAELGGAIFARCSNITIINSTFVDNHAAYVNFSINDAQCSECVSCSDSWTIVEKRFCRGGAVALLQSRANIGGSIFINNTGNDGRAGVLSVEQGSVATLNSSNFLSGSALQFGGTLVIDDSNVTIKNCTFHNSSVSSYGGVVAIGNSSVMVIGSRFSNNIANTTGGVLMIEVSNLTVSDCWFINNTAKYGEGGVIGTAGRNRLTFENSNFTKNRAAGGGGVLYSFQSVITFHGICNLRDNLASTGGAVYAVESTINTYNEMMLMSNKATDTGGGLYLYHSELNCQHNSTVTVSKNQAKTVGGGAHAINSLITVYTDRSYPQQASMNFSENSAHRGGGICLEAAAQLRIQKSGDKYCNGSNKNLYFISNLADLDGEAIYVVDKTYFEVCAGGSGATAKSTECFIQVLSLLKTVDREYSLVSLEIVPNGRTSKSSIYGGLLDRCTPSSSAEVSIKYIHQTLHGDGVTYLKNISNVKNTSSITSSPVRLCSCTSTIKTNCNSEMLNRTVKKGESFDVSLVAVDQVNRTVPNVMIYSSIKYAESGLGKGQMIQMTNNNYCTKLSFNVYSPSSSELLTLYANGPCRNASMSQIKINITFSLCTCPTGFQPSQTEKNSTNCECVCDSSLKMSHYITDNNLKCNSQTGLLTRKGSFYITSMKFNDSSDNSSGYLIYPHCPFNYCLPPSRSVSINLSLENGADVQCAYKRSGILCGACRLGLSLSLGSSRCLHCPKAWYKQFVPIVIMALIAGVVLIILLMVLNLTVAVGTLNGLIFYANIMDTNSNVLFHSSKKFSSFFISWLNLRVGIDICFLEGMDSYWKAWLLMAFPSYVIFLVIMVIIVSEHSVRLSRLIAKRNPVATLATLILLSYTMFLRTIITALSFATLDYPDGSHKRVWLPDATIEYLSGKHIALFIVAILILTVGIAYTCLLFFWQWLLRFHDKTKFKWIMSQRLCHFIEPYHAPFEFKYRYWTGLLLFARVVLYLVFALNVSGDPDVNLLAITVLLTCIFFLKGHIGRIYKSSAVDKIEMAYYLITALISVSHLFVLKVGSEQAVDAIAYVSGAITVLLFFVVISYHLWTETCTKLTKKCKQRGRRADESEDLTNCQPDPENSGLTIPTFSVVEGLPHQDRSHSAVNEQGQRSNPTHFMNGNNDDDISVISTDSVVPLLGGNDY